LLHGNPAHLGHYDSVRASLCQVGDVYLVDMPGFGQSPVASTAPSIAFQAQCALLAARAMGAQGRLDVIGHSHGGAVAQAAAALFADEVRSLVLIGSVTVATPFAYRSMSLPAMDAALVPIIRALAHRWTRASLRAMVNTALRLGTYPEVWFDAAWVEREVALIVANPTVVKTSLQTARAFDAALLARYAAAIRAPILVVHGDRDILVPIRHMEAHARLFAASARVQWARLEGVGHLPHITRPSQVNPLLVDWFEHTPASPPDTSSARLSTAGVATS
jgi:pimeloyl-ACP methyl ester carboxylesterase